MQSAASMSFIINRPVFGMLQNIREYIWQIIAIRMFARMGTFNARVIVGVSEYTKGLVGWRRSTLFALQTYYLPDAAS